MSLVWPNMIWPRWAPRSRPGTYTRHSDWQPDRQGAGPARQRGAGSEDTHTAGSMLGKRRRRCHSIDPALCAHQSYLPWGPLDVRRRAKQKGSICTVYKWADTVFWVSTTVQAAGVSQLVNDWWCEVGGGGTSPQPHHLTTWSKLNPCPQYYLTLRVPEVKVYKQFIKSFENISSEIFKSEQCIQV